jgi:hypothetical protein
MRDEDLDRELSALLDGELTPARARQLREEIEADPRLRERLAQFESLDERLRALPQAPLPAQLGARTRERIRQGDAGHYDQHHDQHHDQHDGRETGRPSASIARWGVPLAAALAACLVAVWLMRPASDSHESVRPEQLAGQLQGEPQAQLPEQPRARVQRREQRQTQQARQEQAQNQLNPDRADAVRRPEADIEPDDSSDEQTAIAHELATLRDLDLIQELDLLEALLAMETTRDGPG